MKNIKAAVLLAHGLNDYNVVPEHSVRIYDEMKARGLPVSMYLHQGGHGGNPPADMLNRWFSHYLYGVDNGVEKDPPVWIVQDAAAQEPRALAAAARRRRLAQCAAVAAPTAVAPVAGAGADEGCMTPPTPFASFPVPGSVPVVFHPHAGGTGVANLVVRARRSSGTDKFVDDVAMSGSIVRDAWTQSPHRLLYATPTFTDTVHISGTPKVTLRIASSAPAANLSVWLVMLPYDSTRAGSQSHVGLSSIAAGRTSRTTSRSRRAATTTRSVPGEKLVPGKFYDLTFDLQPDDEFVPAGKRLAVMIMSSDREFTLWPKAGTELTIDLAHSSFSIPIVGGTKRARPRWHAMKRRLAAGVREPSAHDGNHGRTVTSTGTAARPVGPISTESISVVPDTGLPPTIAVTSTNMQANIGGPPPRTATSYRPSLLV